MDAAGVIRTILIVDIVILSLLALIYLLQRRMHWTSFFGWGLLAVLVPVLGPFMVIARRPGEWDPHFSISREFRRLARTLQIVRRVLPEPPRVRKLTRLERARLRRRSGSGLDQRK